MRRLTVLEVPYALAPVGPDAVGGAEQIVSALDQALTAGGHRSLVVGCAGSAVAGTLIGTGIDPAGAIDEAARRRAERATREAVADTVARERIDLVHMHGLDFQATLPAAGPPVLVTLHLPPAWYAKPPERRPDTWYHCVSDAQHRTCTGFAPLLPPIGNGVPVERLAGLRCRRRFALTLGRVCPEKGQHLALHAARRAGMRLLIGGAVFPYQAHQAYWRESVAPLLDRDHRFVGPLGFRAKRRALSAAACLLVPSSAAETSSLVAMEALACGTPVIAFRAGALSEIVADGRTGFLVNDADEMADAIGRLGSIDADTCRREARSRFDIADMVDGYLARYRWLADRAVGAPV